MSGRQVKRKGDTNSALIHQLLAVPAGGGIDSIQLIRAHLTNGATATAWTTTPIVQYPAADQNATGYWIGHAPIGMTTMTNPTLVIEFSGAAADTWTILAVAHASKHGEAQGNNLFNDSFDVTAGAGATFYFKDVVLTGTIEAGDIVAIRLIKTSNDAQILYISGAAYIKRS